MTTPRGFILYEGPSRIDGEPIVCIATMHSRNVKTGDMVQTFILRADVSPLDAIRCGADASVCSDCPHRGIGGKRRSCYVNVAQSPTAVYHAFRRGSYADLPPSRYAATFAGRAIRAGAYGDPGAVPSRVWHRLADAASAMTGYTHQWRHRPSLRPLMMASADTVADARTAHRRGWRTFRVRSADVMLPSEIGCPSVSGVRCIDCKLCSGASRLARSITIDVHGSGASNASGRID